MALNYGWEKTYLAVRGLASSSQSLQARLGDAYVFNLAMLREEDVTAEVWPRLQTLKQKLTWRQAIGNEGTVAATTSQLTDLEASELIGEIVDLFNQVAEDYFGSEKQKGSEAQPRAR